MCGGVVGGLWGVSLSVTHGLRYSHTHSVALPQDHACFFRGDTAVTTTVAFNPANWPSTGAWAGKARCGTCFTVSCNSGASTFGISGATSCAGRSVLAQLTNKCPECSERKGSWGSCDTCSGFHVDLWSDTFAAVCGVVNILQIYIYPLKHTYSLHS